MIKSAWKLQLVISPKFQLVPLILKAFVKNYVCLRDFEILEFLMPHLDQTIAENYLNSQSVWDDTMASRAVEIIKSQPFQNPRTDLIMGKRHLRQSHLDLRLFEFIPSPQSIHSVLKSFLRKSFTSIFI